VQLLDALLGRVPDCLDSPQGQCIRGVNLKSDEFAYQGETLLQGQTVGSPTDGMILIFDGTGWHVTRIVSRKEKKPAIPCI
jgi:hypothetical protein